jgi:hypothetical protein
MPLILAAVWRFQEHMALYNECETRSQIRDCDITVTAKIFHPLLALIASATDKELAKYVEFLKEENRILRERVPGQIHTKPSERERLLMLGKQLGRAVEELLTIVSPSTFYRWVKKRTGDRSRRIRRAASGSPKNCGRSSFASRPRQTSDTRGSLASCERSE